MKDIRTMTEKEIRIMLVKGFIEVLEGEKDDPRQADALAFYKQQLETLEGKPENIVISLKPGLLFGKNRKLGGYNG